jgi:tripartite ATP-independent transporter DctM subunit
VSTAIIILILSFIILLAIGVPIAYSIGLSVMFTLLVSVPSMAAYTTIAQRMATGLNSFALIAIPFFVLAGELMNRGGIARRLIDFAKALVGMLPGGLAYVNILACMLFGAISGSAIAAASAIGGFMTERMVKDGYQREFSAAVNITSSTTGLIIPPSNVLIVYSLASGGASIAALFLAGYLPGLLVGLLLIFVAGYFAYINKYPVGSSIKLTEVVRSFFIALPSLFLLLIIIGGIVAGIFTATEASAVAVLYAFVLSFLIYKEISLAELPQIFLNAVKTTSVVALLIGTSMAMSWVMSYENIPQDAGTLLLSVSNNKVVVLLMINIFLLFIGVFMDITPAVLIFTPIFLPIVTKLGVDPVHFGIIMVLNLCIGLTTPPVGSVLFVGCSVAGVNLTKVIKPLLPLYVAMITALILITFIPEITLWLPRMFGF